MKSTSLSTSNITSPSGLILLKSALGFLFKSVITTFPFPVIFIPSASSAVIYFVSPSLKTIDFFISLIGFLFILPFPDILIPLISSSDTSKLIPSLTFIFVLNLSFGNLPLNFIFLSAKILVPLSGFIFDKSVYSSLKFVTFTLPFPPIFKLLASLDEIPNIESFNKFTFNFDLLDGNLPLKSVDSFKLISKPFSGLMPDKSTFGYLSKSSIITFPLPIIFLPLASFALILNSCPSSK